MAWIRRKEHKVNNLSSKNKSVDMRDSGWAWVVAIACCFGLTLSLSILNCLGIFYSYMIEEFEFELTALTIIGSINSTLSFSGAIFVVPIIEKFGTRKVIIGGGLLQSIGLFLSSFVSSFPLLFFSLGIVTGFGTACSYVTFYVAVDQYFYKKKSIATPMASTGASWTIMLFSPVSEALLERYGFHGTMLIFSAIILNIVVCGAIIFPIKANEIESGQKQPNTTKDPHGDFKEQQQTEKETTKEPDKSPQLKSDLSFCKQPRFFIFLVSNFLFLVAFFIPIGLLPETAVSKGIDLDRFAIAFSLSGLTQNVGRLCFGILSYRFSTCRPRIWGIFILLEAATTMIVPFASDFVHYLIFYLLSGIFRGGGNIGYNMALSNIVEPQNFGRAISFALLMQGLGGLLGNPFAAFLQKSTGNIDIPYYFGSFVFAVAGILMLPFPKASVEKPLEFEVVVSKDGFDKESVEFDKNSLYDRETFSLTDIFI